MSRRVLLTTYALADLDALFDYIAYENPVTAQNYISGLHERCEFYAASPFAGRAESDIARRLSEPAESVCSFLYRNHRCYYIVTDDEIRVPGFIDTRRNLDRALDERLRHRLE